MDVLFYSVTAKWSNRSNRTPVAHRGACDLFLGAQGKCMVSWRAELAARRIRSVAYRAARSTPLDDFLGKVDGFLRAYEPLSLPEKRDDDDERGNNVNLRVFLHEWFEGSNDWILNLVWLTDAERASFVKDHVADLPPGRLCALVGITAPNGELHAYLLYRDSPGEPVYMYNGRGAALHVDLGVPKSPIVHEIQNVQESFHREGLGMCMPAMCFLAMVHKRMSSMRMADIVNALCRAPYARRLDDLFKRFNRFLITRVYEINDAFQGLFVDAPRRTRRVPKRARE